MSDRPYEIAHLDDLERLPVDDEGLVWRPIRRRFGISAFGTNAYTAEKAGDRVVEEHFERGGHEELYFVATGRARFTLGDDEHDAPAGTLVFVRDPALKRAAVARDPRTTIFTVGGKPGEAYAPLAWEENSEIIPLFGTGEYAEAKARLEQALDRYPDAGGLLYNLACAESRLGETDAALAHLERAIEIWPGFRDAAMGDPDFESVRDYPLHPR